MAIVTQNLPIIFKACRELKTKDKLLILGEAHIFFDLNLLKFCAAQSAYPIEPQDRLSNLNWRDFGTCLGFRQVDCLDINGKANIQLDLHESLPVELIGKYDCIIDAGTLFWCFSPGTALLNIFRMAKTNGVIVHSTAITGFFGRGYYNIHPRAFFDFYRQNRAGFLGFSTHTRRSRNQSLPARAVRKILRAFTGEDDPLCLSETDQSFFVVNSKRDQLEFGKKYLGREPDQLPNNVTGTLAFIKSTSVEPIFPVQIL